MKTMKALWKRLGNVGLGAAISLVGTASFGGEFGLGTLYQLKPGTGTFEVLHSFAGGDDDGASPVAGRRG